MLPTDSKKLKILGAVKNIIKVKNNDVIKTETGLNIYKCINKINGLECKGDKSDRRGTGMVLKEGEECFDCQFGNVPQLRLNVDVLPSSSQFLSPNPNKSPLSPKHRRSNSHSILPSPTYSIWTQKTDESEVDPFMFTPPESLKRSGAIIKTTKQSQQVWTRRRQRSHSEGDVSENLLVSEIPPTSNHQIIAKKPINRTPIPLPNLVESPWLSVVGQLNNKFESELQKTIKEIVKEELKGLTVENQKLKEENECLKQRIIEMEEKSAEKSLSIYEMYFEVPSSK